MKIAVVGCGALGSYYGANLCRDHHDVHFLLRSDYDVVKRRGVRVQSPQGDFTVRPRAAKSPIDIGIVDLVVIGLKTGANSEFSRLLPALVGNATAILTLQNGLGNEEALEALFPCENIMGGLCFVCLNRLEPGVIQHIAHGKVVLGEYKRWPEPRTHDIAGLFRHAGIACHVTDNLERAHWEKLVWNIPFNGLGVASSVGLDRFLNAHQSPLPSASFSFPSLAKNCLTTDALLSNPQWEGIVRELMSEVIQTANALGFPLTQAIADAHVANTRNMGTYKPSTLVDFERGQPLEIKSLFEIPLQKARSLNVSTPRLELLVSILKELSPSATHSARSALNSTPGVEKSEGD